MDRGAIMRRLRSPEAPLCALVLGAYAYFYQAGGWNQNSRFDLTRAIVERGTLSIDAYAKNTGDTSARHGRLYCDKAPGLSFVAVPPYAIHRWLSGSDRPSARELAVASYLCTLISVGVPSAIAVVMLSLLFGSLGLSPAARVTGAAAYGLGTLAFPYATLLYGHQLVAALLVIAFALLVRARRAGRASAGTLALVGFLLGAAVAVEYPAAIAALAIGIYALAFVRPFPRVLWIGAGALVPAIALVAYHAAAFGGPFTLPYEFSTQKHRHMGFFMGLGAPQPGAIENLLVTPYRGIFYSMPWLALAIPGGVLLARRRDTRAETIVCAVVFVLFLWLNVSLVDWQGGWAMGARYLVPALPFLAILAAGVLTVDLSRARAVAWSALGFLAAIALALMLVGTAVKPEVPGHIRKPFSEYLLPAFRRGDLAISTQSIDMKGHPQRGPKQAWNLGQAAGLDGGWSLAPLAVWSAGATAAILVALARRRAGED